MSTAVWLSPSGPLLFAIPLTPGVGIGQNVGTGEWPEKDRHDGLHEDENE